MEDFYFLDMQQAYYSYILSLLDESVQSDEDNCSSVYFNTSCSAQTLRAFINYLFSRMNCSLEVYVLSLLYIERLHSNCPSLITYNSIVGIILASVIVAHKYHEETSYYASFYAQLANISVFQLNRLEVDFISRIDFSLFVSSSDYYNFYHHLCSCATCPNAPFPNVCLPSLLAIPTNSDSLLLYANDPQELQRRARYATYRASSLSQVLPVSIPMQPLPLPSYFSDQGSTPSLFDSTDSLPSSETHPLSSFPSPRDFQAKIDCGQAMAMSQGLPTLPMQPAMQFAFGYCVPLSVQLIAPVFLVRPPVVCGGGAIEDGCARSLNNPMAFYYAHPLYACA